jgi:hypothetical protein
MKKRNLFIGIALVAVILVALYLANNGSILEGNQSGPAAPTINVADALKTVEDILSGALKMDGTGPKELDEYVNDLTNNSICLDNGTKNEAVPVASIIKSTKTNNTTKHEIYEMAPNVGYPAPAKLSYNDTFQVIYAAGKMAASSKTAGSEITGNLKVATPYFYLYSAFTSKLFVNISAIIKSNDSSSKAALSDILNKYTYTVTDEGPPPVNQVTITFVSSLSYVRLILNRIYAMSSAGVGGLPTKTDKAPNPLTSMAFLLCNFSGKLMDGKNAGKNAGVLNYTIPGILKSIEGANLPEPTIQSRNIKGTDPYFIQILQSSIQPTSDAATIFSDYKIHPIPDELKAITDKKKLGEKIKPLLLINNEMTNSVCFAYDLHQKDGKLTIALSTLEKNKNASVTYPKWFIPQPASMSK